MSNEIMLRPLSNVPTYSRRQSMNTVHVQGRRKDFFSGRCVFYNKVLISSHFNINIGRPKHRKMGQSCRVSI